MAVFQKIREFFVPFAPGEQGEIVPAPPCEYEIRALTEKNLKEVLRLNLRCFKTGENYTRGIFQHLLTMPNGLSYQITTEKGEMAGFIFLGINDANFGHITTVGVAPEHRRRGLAVRLLEHGEEALRKRKIYTVFLEVRVGNFAAQNLYKSRGYAVTQRVAGYYTNGEDCYLMMKSL